MRALELLKYIILGIIQGITEPLPISSSGHVFILKNMLKSNILNDLNFEIIVNAGSLLAVIMLYKKDIVSLIKSFIIYVFKKEKLHKNGYMYSLKIITGVIPIMICGLLFKEYIEYNLNDINIVGYGFIITSILLFVSRNKKGTKKQNEITFRDALEIGFASVIALIPGISRSGTAYVACLSKNIERKDALKYSFMMYIPISIGTIILGITDILSSISTHELLIPYTIGFIFSFMTSFLSLKWFLNKVTTNNLKYFALYCLIIGLIIIFII